MKKCTKCGIEKPLSEFYKQKSGKNGFRADCKKCANSYTNANWEKYHYKQYGISLAEKQQMVKNQENKCALCKKELKNKYRKPKTEEHKAKLRKPKPKVVCRLKDKKEMSLGNFMNWNKNGR